MFDLLTVNWSGKPDSNRRPQPWQERDGTATSYCKGWNTASFYAIKTARFVTSEIKWLVFGLSNRKGRACGA